MIHPRYARRRFALYLIPVIIGLGGVAFSRQFDNAMLRMLIVLVSVSVPLFAGGNLLARHHGGRYEQLFLWFGLLLLLGGAAVSVSGFSDNLMVSPWDSLFLVDVARWIGIASLSLGLFVVLFSVVRAGEDIEEVAERFWRLAEHISEGFVLSTSDGTIFLVNKQFLHMTDLTEEQVLGRNASELANRLNVTTLQEHLDRRRSGVSSEYEVTWRVRGEERRLWFSGTPIHDDNGRHTANLATVRDITEFHQLSQRVERYAESLKELVEEQSKKLVQSEERFRQLLLSMNEGFLTLDTVNTVRFANARLCQILEVSEAEIVGRDIFDFVASEGRVRLLNLLAKSSAADPAENRQEIPLLSAGGDLLPVLAGVSYLREAGVGDAVYSMVITNVTDLKEMQRELAARADELEQANEELMLHDRAKDSFLSNVSHELRTPLATVQGYIEMLNSGTLGEVQPAQVNACRVMQRNIERLLLLINEMIDFSRMEIRGVSLQMNLYQPARLVPECVASFVPQAAAKGIALITEDESGDVVAWGDRERLAQVLGILLNNAIKFTPASGEIVVRATQGQLGTVQISVSDNGIGIDATYQEKVFDKFFQVDSSKSRRYEGAGIGLSIAKSIIEAHGGTLTLSSVLGQGSTFVIELPRTVFHTEQPLEFSTALSLITVDDPGLLSGALQRLVPSPTMQIRRADGAAHALREAEDELPDAILINDGPEDIAGEVSIGLFRREPVTSQVPLVICTAEPSTRYAETSARWQRLSFLPKPFAPEALLNALRLAVDEDAEEDSDDILGAMLAPDTRPRVLVVDSDPGLLEWVETAFSNRNILCYCAASVPAALQMLAKDPPNVIFVDADGPGSQVLEQVNLLAHAENVEGRPIFVMTGTRDELGPLNGVRGVLRKPFAFGEMLALVPQTPRPS